MLAINAIGIMAGIVVCVVLALVLNATDSRFRD